MAVLSRRGRKRKFRGTKPGRVVEVIELTPREIAASQPHRRELPEAIRHDQRAVSELGRMCLFDQISDDMERAGNLFLGHYGAFMATAGGPRSGAGSGRGFDCVGDAGCHDCECRRRQDRYEGALKALRDAGTVAVNAVFLVAIHDRRCPPKWQTPFRWGLEALAKHYGLTRSPSSYKRK